MNNRKTRYAMLSGIILLALIFINTAQSQTDDLKSDDESIDIIDDIAPYEGSVGPGSVLYGLKTAFEEIDESLTFNSSRKLEKQEEHARQRLAEAKAGLNKKDIEETNRALERYREKVEEMENSVSGFTGNDSHLLTEQRRIVKHQFVLRQLRETHPNITGLERALNNSLRLEERFELKTRVKLEREIEDSQRIRLREIEVERKEIEVEVRGNTAEIKVKTNFQSNSTERTAVEKEVLDRFKLNTEEINRLTEFKVEAGTTPEATRTPTVTPTASPGATPTATATPTVTGTSTPSVTGTPAVTGTPTVTGTPEQDKRERLKIKIKAKDGVSEVEAELRFQLNTADRNEITERIFQKLSSLTIEDIQRAEIEEQREDRRENRREDRLEERREDRQDDRRTAEAGDDRGGSAGEAGDDRGGSSGSSGSSGGGSSGSGSGGSGGGGGDD